MTVGTAAGNLPTIAIGWDGLGRLNSVNYSSGSIQTYAYWPSGMRAQTMDTGNAANNRRYAYTSDGLLLSEYVAQSGAVGHASAKAAKVSHRSSGGDIWRSLGAFSSGETVTVSVWFKAPVGVTGSMYLTDNAAFSPTDAKKFVTMPGNGDWQQLSLTQTLTTAATLSLHLYGDMYTSTSSSATDSTFVTYDDVLVSSSTRGAVFTEGFESDISTWNSCSGNLALAQPGTVPDQWKRDVIYLGGQAIAEVDAAGVHELHNDYLGTPRVITSRATGAVEGAQAFGPYGEILPPYTSGYVPLIGYTGHLAQDTTGLVYMRGRFYSPAWHRFLNSDQGVDPSTFNQMAYVGGSPMQAMDPSGLAAEAFRCENGFLIHRVWEDDGKLNVEVIGSCDSGSINLSSSAIGAGYSAGRYGGIVFSYQSRVYSLEMGYDSGMVTHYQFYNVDYENWQDSASKLATGASIGVSVLENGTTAGSTAAKFGKTGGVIMLPLTTALDMSNPKVSGTHTISNFMVGFTGLLIGGVPGAIVGGAYSVVDSFYPGGWFGLMLTPTSNEAQQIKYMRFK